MKKIFCVPSNFILKLIRVASTTASPLALVPPPLQNIDIVFKLQRNYQKIPLIRFTLWHNYFIIVITVLPGRRPVSPASCTSFWHLPQRDPCLKFQSFKEAKLLYTFACLYVRPCVFFWHSNAAQRLVFFTVIK